MMSARLDGIRSRSSKELGSYKYIFCLRHAVDDFGAVINKTAFLADIFWGNVNLGKESLAIHHRPLAFAQDES